MIALINIEATKEFVIDVVGETLAEAMNITAAPYPGKVDEFKEAGMTPVMADLSQGFWREENREKSQVALIYPT